MCKTHPRPLSFMLKRKIYDSLLEWKNRSGGESAVLVEGARRVGKSMIVEEFAKNEYKDYILIDFLLSDEKKVIPVEVKSSGYRRHASFDHFREKHHRRIVESYIVYSKNYDHREGVTYLPVYMCMCL